MPQTPAVEWASGDGVLPAPHSPPSRCTSQNGQGPSHGLSVDHHHPWSIPASLPPLPSGATLASGLDLVVGTGLTLSVGPGMPDGRGWPLCSTPAQVIPFPGPSLGELGRWLPHALAKDMEDTKPQSEAPRWTSGPAVATWDPAARQGPQTALGVTAVVSPRVLKTRVSIWTC